MEDLLGLSPPTRGSLWDLPFGGSPQGSIPAHTGEASGTCLSAETPKGLSPPTRGSRRVTVRLAECGGSIPAHTGKPAPCPGRCGALRVYPRPHGEAGLGRGAHAEPPGLSPPTRGSRRARSSGRRGTGSIPAHTGKPGSRSVRSSRLRVYPRPHGEALVGRRSRRAVIGLSPPTRGSPPEIEAASGSIRSIPAHTGKPFCGASG